MNKFKVGMMKKIIRSRQNKKGLDVNYAENYELNINGDYSINNSYYFSMHNYKSEESLYIRLGERADKTTEIWVYYEDKDNKYFYKNLYLKKGKESPLKVYKDKETHNWNFDFKGKLNEVNNINKEHEFEIHGEFIKTHDIIDFFTNMPPRLTALAMSKEKWNKKFFKEVGENNQVHYEEEGKAKVKIKIDAKIEKIVAFNCVRDHSYGKRLWDYMNNHLWLSAINDDIAFNFSMVSYPSLTILEVGNLRLNESDKPLFLKEAKYDLNEVIKGEVPSSFKLTYISEDNQTFDIQIKILSFIPYYFEENKYCLNEGIAEFKINEKVSRGIFEIGFNHDKTRFFNNRDLRRLK